MFEMSCQHSPLVERSTGRMGLSFDLTASVNKFAFRCFLSVCLTRFSLWKTCFKLDAFVATLRVKHFKKAT